MSIVPDRCSTTEKISQQLFRNMVNRELSITTGITNPDESTDNSISKLGILLRKVNKSKMKLFNTKHIEDKKDTVESVFNVQHNKLNSQFIKRQSCCLLRKTQNIKISARLKREAGDLYTCACQQGQNSLRGREIKNMLGGEGHRRLKIFVRI
jgi:hypothetical protein